MRFYLENIQKMIPKKFMMPENLTSKILENALRIFENKVTKPQMKTLKTVIRWIWKKTTTVLARMHENQNIETKKFIEKTSHHLWNMNIVEIVEKKSLMCVKKAIKEAEEIFISYDESDIFKPDAKCMPWLSKIRDWSTWLIGNWYIFRWVNVNWISLFSHLEVANEEMNEKKKTEKTIITIWEVRKVLWDCNWIYIIDRGWDSVILIDDMLENNNRFIIRMKKTRKILDLKTNKIKKITEFWIWLHQVEIEWWTKVILCVAKRKWFRENVLLITNDENLSLEQVVSYYLKRRKIEEDFNKMKDLWLEEIRLLNIDKIKNLIALVQFVIVLSQDIYNEVMGRSNLTYQHIHLYFAKYCKWKSLTLNPQSFIKFVSENLISYEWYDTTQEPMICLFGTKREMKKMGII